jgi:MFS family permease
MSGHASEKGSRPAAEDRPGPPPHRSGLAMILICTAQFVLQLDFSIVNVALPTIQRDLHLAAAQLQWIVTGYALTFGSLLLAARNRSLATWQATTAAGATAGIVAGGLLTQYFGWRAVFLFREVT